MPRIGVSITKSCVFRNSVQEFSNVYYFEMLTTPNNSEANTIIDSIVTKEKLIHSNVVTFKRGRVWSQVGSPSANNMIAQKTLSGTGAGGTVTNQDKERAYLFRLRAGVDSRGNPVYLRKWFHACGVFATGVIPTSTILANETGFSGAEQSTLEAAVGWIGDGGGAPGSLRLCSKNGRLPDAGATWKSHPFLEHHQLGDQWRAQ